MSTEENGLAPWKLLRPKPQPGQCPECAVFHPPDMPHNQQSMFYQYSFREKHGRWPTWSDALAHCTPHVRQQWIEQLKLHGVTVPEPETNSPPPCASSNQSQNSPPSDSP
jgi:hypothetical protein